MCRSLNLLVVAAIACLACQQTFAEQRSYVFQHEHVLGTSLELRIKARDINDAHAVEKAALSEIERLARVLSSYDSESELMMWQEGRLGDQHQLSADLKNVLRRAEHWRIRTGGAFDIRTAELSNLWRLAERRQEQVSEQQRKRAMKEMRRDPYLSISDDEFYRGDSLAISLDGLAKGYILDRVCRLITSSFPEVKAFAINIGGDLRMVGDSKLTIAIEDPHNAFEQSEAFQSIELNRPMAVATSGNYRRRFQIAGRDYSHIIDPRTSFPADHLVSTTVLAESAIDADALATSISVLSANEGIGLVDSLEKTECLVILANGDIRHSKHWPGDVGPTVEQFVAKKADDESHSGLTVKFTLKRSKKGGYRRPYVAVWLEDQDGFPVKTAILWMQTEQPGPRWHRDLTRWYRNDRARKLVEKTALIGTVSGATRGPGEYVARFDGTDNAGRPLPAGEYTLCLEVAREHGTYQIIREKVALGPKPIAAKELAGNVEMGGVEYEYLPSNLNIE